MFLFSSLRAFWHVHLVEKSFFSCLLTVWMLSVWQYFFIDVVRLYNISTFILDSDFSTNFLIYCNSRQKSFRAIIRLLKYSGRWSSLQFTWQKFSSTMNISKVIFEKPKKMLRIANFGPMESRCLADEPKHFPFAFVIVFIIKSTLTCTPCWKKAMYGDF